MLAWDIACRYLFAKKSHAAINAISLVAACGVAVITTALVCTLSVYNGFEALVAGLCSNFDPDIRIEAKTGKTFRTDNDSLLNALAGHPDIEAVSRTLEETVLLAYNGRQVPATIKGVDNIFQQTSSIDSILRAGTFTLSDAVVNYTVMGAGLANQIGVGVGFLRPITVYCPKRKGKINLLRPNEAFTEGELFCSGVFAVDQVEYDDRLFLSSLDFVHSLLGDSTILSAYEIRIRPGTDADAVRKDLQQSVGPSFTVLTRMELQADSYKIMQIEKWITFLIIFFILVIASFNVIGALSMLIIDKEAEIATLHNLGADDRLITRIFFWEGWLISGSGAVVGIILGIVLCLIQEHFGVIPLGDGSAIFIIDSYPVQLQWSDVAWTFLCVSIIGLLATLYPLHVLRHKGR